MADHHYGYLDQVHILLSLVIMAGYMTVPFTVLRRIPLPRITQVSGLCFFATCAITHVGLAVGVHDSPWFVLNDLIQAVSVITFIVTLSKMVATVMKQRDSTNGLNESRKAEVENGPQ